MRAARLCANAPEDLAYLDQLATQGEDLANRIHRAAHGSNSSTPSMGELNSWRHRVNEVGASFASSDRAAFDDFVGTLDPRGATLATSMLGGPGAASTSSEPASDGFWDEVDALRQEIDELERQRHDVRARLREFEERYRRVIASRNAELERVRAEVAAARSQRDYDAERRARQAEEVASRLTPKERHRSMIKRIHPDRAANEEDRAFREDLAKRINDALDRNDMEEFDWLETEVDLYSRDSAGEMDRESIRDRLRERLAGRAADLSEQIASVKAQQLWALLESAIAAERDGRDLLEEIAADIDEQIELLREELDRLVNG